MDSNSLSGFKKPMFLVKEDPENVPKAQAKKVMKVLKKDKPAEDLINVLPKLETFNTAIPENVTSSIMRSSGCSSSDARITKLISLATEQFVANIADLAYRHCEIRKHVQKESHSKKKNSEFTLNKEDLDYAMKELGVSTSKMPFSL